MLAEEIVKTFLHLHLKYATAELCGIGLLMLHHW